MQSSLRGRMKYEEFLGTAMATSSESKVPHAPVFVEVDTMLDRMTELTPQISAKAFDLFTGRSGREGSGLDDWLQAELEFVQPTPVEITETNDSIKVRAAVPGFQVEEIEASMDDTDLFLAGQSRSEIRTEDEKTFYSEWRSNRFCRRLRLPANVETEGVDTKLQNGILTLTLKKKPVPESV